MKRGKKYVEAAKKVDRSQLYDVNDAISTVKWWRYRKATAR